jgi:hypothetical protein
MRWLATDNLDLELADAWRDPGVSADSIALVQLSRSKTPFGLP